MTEPTYDVVCWKTDGDYWDQRKTGIGASEAPAVLDCCPYKSAFAVYHEKVDALPAADLGDKEWINWGNLLERSIAQEYGRRTGTKVSMCGHLLRSREHPWAMCSLDAWQEKGGVLSPLEIKNVSAWKADDWAGGAPRHHVVQAHQQMLVTGATSCTVAALIGGQKLVYDDIERDDQLMRSIVFKGAQFWQRVLDREPPTVDDSDSTEDAIKRMYPSDDGRTVVLPDELCDAVERWDRLAPELKLKERELKGIKNRVREALGVAQWGELSNDYAVSWKTNAKGARVLLLKKPRSKAK